MRIKVKVPMTAAEVEGAFGPRCGISYEPGCVVCDAWQEWDNGNADNHGITLNFAPATLVWVFTHVMD